VVLAAILGSLGVVQARQATEKNRLDSELALVEENLGDTELDQAGSQQEETQSLLSGTSADLDTARARLSQSTDSIEAHDTLFNIARTCSVQVNNITIAPLSSENLVDIPCTILSLTVIVEGEVPQLLNFIMTLNTDVTNGVVSSARISVPVETGEQELPKADVKMAIYYYEDE
jgi:hypothetical protein